MNKIRVIDLLNKIANGEIPNKIKYLNDTFKYDNGIDYVNSDNQYLFGQVIPVTKDGLNKEVEIIEEDKKIKKLNYIWEETEDGYEICDKELVNKINEIIDVVNKLKEEE